jgi:superfamily II DNA or RNA helicase
MVIKITPFITKNGIEISVDSIINTFTVKGYKSILRKFTLRYKSPIGTYYIEKKIYNFSKCKKKIYLPRFSLQPLLDAGIIGSPIVSIPEGDDLDIKFLGEPTHNQKIVVDYLLNNNLSKDKQTKGCAGATVCMTAGGGKTFLAMYIMSIIKKKTLIIVPNTYLLHQWRELISEFMPEVNLGVYYGKEKKDGDVVIGIVNSLSKENIVKPSLNKGGKKNDIINSGMYCNKFGLVILDESHIYCTDSFSSIYKNIQSKFMLGLSATPNEREDGTDKISHLNIGEVIFCKDIHGYISEDNQFDSNVKIIKYSGPADYSENKVLESTGMISVPLMLESLIQDPYRNELIINSIFEMLEYEDMNLFVFSDRRSHCEILEEMFVKKLIDKGCLIENIQINNNSDTLEISCTMYGGCKEDIVNRAKHTANVIFTTYAYSSTGVSIDKLNGLILATPRRSKAVQILGRVFRNKKEYLHKKRLIIDICDINSCLKQQLYGRIPAYKERNSTIEYVSIDYTNIKKN